MASLFGGQERDLCALRVGNGARADADEREIDGRMLSTTEPTDVGGLAVPGISMGSISVT
jgi:hypothetical protein